MIQFNDSVTISGTRLRDDGYLVVDARIARTGIQTYLGIEVGKPELATVDVYRPENEVFSDKAMASFAYRPVTDDHPSEGVNASNWKKLAVGQTDGEIKRDGDFIRVPMMVSDGAAITKIQDGKRELSAGYTCDLVFAAGTTPDGRAYDAIQTNIRANHVAIVAKGRAGKECRIGDAALEWSTAPIVNDKEIVMKVILVDGLQVETTDASHTAIEKLLRDRDGLQTQINTLTGTHAAAIAAKDAELSKQAALVDATNAKVLDAAAISKLVADRVALEATALKLAKDVKPTGLTDGALKLAVVKAVLGDKVSTEKLADQLYVDARFDILAEDAGKTVDTFRDTRMASPSVTNPAQLTDALALRQKAFDDLAYFDEHGKERAN